MILQVHASATSSAVSVQWKYVALLLGQLWKGLNNLALCPPETSNFKVFLAGTMLHG